MSEVENSRHVSERFARGQRVRLPDKTGIWVVAGVEPEGDGCVLFIEGRSPSGGVASLYLTASEAERVEVVSEDGGGSPGVVLAAGMDFVPSETTPGRWHRVRNTLFGAPALSIFSIAIAVLALAGFAYMAYEEIKPTLVVGAHFEEQEPFERTDKVLVTVSVSNTGRRSATDVTIRVDRKGCGIYEHSRIQIGPGYRAVPWFEECDNRPPGGTLRVDVTYNWDLGWFTRSYSISHTFDADHYGTVDIAPY